jgi:hypothetical protein
VQVPAVGSADQIVLSTFVDLRAANAVEIHHGAMAFLARPAWGTSCLQHKRFRGLGIRATPHVIILVVVLLLFGGGFYGRGRWW